MRVVVEVYELLAETGLTPAAGASHAILTECPSAWY